MGVSRRDFIKQVAATTAASYVGMSLAFTPQKTAFAGE